MFPRFGFVILLDNHWYCKCTMYSHFTIQANITTNKTVHNFTTIIIVIFNHVATITVTTDLNWSEDKIDNLVYGTIAGLGFNLSNGVLVQAGNSMNDKQL